MHSEVVGLIMPESVNSSWTASLAITSTISEAAWYGPVSGVEGAVIYPHHQALFNENGCSWAEGVPHSG